MKESKYKMQKIDLAKKVASQTKLSINTVTKIIDLTLAEIRSEVATGQRITLMDFGTFEKKWRTDRTGINPTTKKPIIIPGHYAVNFKVGRAFKQCINDPRLENRKEANHESNLKTKNQK